MPDSSQSHYKISLPETVSYFKEETFIRTLKLPAQKPDMERLLDCVVWPELLEYKLIETNQGRSYEGKYLSGALLMVIVSLKIKITYVATTPDQSVHAADFETVMTTNVVLPTAFHDQEIRNCIESKSIRVLPYIEASETKMTSPKTFQLWGLLLADVNLE